VGRAQLWAFGTLHAHLSPLLTDRDVQDSVLESWKAGRQDVFPLKRGGGQGELETGQVELETGCSLLTSRRRGAGEEQGLGWLDMMAATQQVVILAGGLGTRLKDVVPDKPKCMAPVGGRPFLEYVLCFLRRQGLTEVILAVGYRADRVLEYFGDGSRFGVRLAYSIEPTPLGTAGALKLADRLLSGDRVIVMNGDSIADVPLMALLRYHTEKRALATIALAQVPNAARYGAVSLGPDGDIVRFQEKSNEGWGVISAGIYVLERRVIADIPSHKPVSLERDVFERLAGSGLYGFEFDGFFIDIGTPEAYYKAQLEVPRRFPC